MTTKYSSLYLSIKEINQSDMVIERWNNVITSILNEAIIVTKEIDENMKDKYVFDFDGLLMNEFDIPLQYLYPIYLINGFRSTLDFDGTIDEIKLIDPSTLARYDAMVRDKKRVYLSTYFK